MKPTIEMPIELAQRIADYLVTRPYREVATLLSELSQCKPTAHPPLQDPSAEGERSKGKAE